MNLRRIARSTSAFALSFMLVAAGSPSPLIAKAPGADIAGKILDKDGVTPVKGLIIRLDNRDTGESFESQPANASGEYKIPNVPDGNYSIVVVTGEGEFELPNRLTIMGGQPSTITVILTAAASRASRNGKPPAKRSTGKATVLIPVIGSIVVAAFAAKEYFEKDEDGSPKLP